MRSMIRPALAAVLLAGAPAALAQEGASRGPGIEVRELGMVDPFQVGTSQALSDQAWVSGDAATTRALLNALPAADSQGWQSGLASRLAARALLSAGPPPRGADNPFALAAIRADRALAAAGAREAFALLERTPRLSQSAALSRIHAEAAFALGETTAACRTADQLLQGRDQAYWLRARAVCSALGGNTAAAELTAELARSVEDAPAFDALLDAYTLNRDLPGDARPTTGIELALAHEVAPQASLQVSEGAPLWLAEAAQSYGPPIDLPQLPADALDVARGLEGTERNAALGALAGQDVDRGVAAEALALRLSEAAANDRFVEVARAYGNEVETLPITAETLAWGKGFVLAALLNGDLETARIWREALMDGPPRMRMDDPFGGAAGGPGTGSASGAAGLVPPQNTGLPAYEPEWTRPPAETMVVLDYALAIAEDRLSGPGFEAILAARVETGTPSRLAEAAGLAALNVPVPASVRAALLPQPQETGEPGEPRELGAMPATGFLPAGLMAARMQALAETQLTAARMVEAGGITPAALYGAAAILEEAGLRREARRLVLEAVAEGAM